MIQFAKNITNPQTLNAVYVYILHHEGLGAAMSQIAALDFTYQYGQDTSYDCTIMNINFGSPRWGNQDLINLYQSRMGNNSIRVVNRKDIVPLVPLRLDLYDLDYVHTPLFIHYDSPQTPAEGNLVYNLCKESEKSDGCHYDILDACPEDHTHYLQFHDATCLHETYSCWSDDAGTSNRLDPNGDGTNELSEDSNDTAVIGAYNIEGLSWKSGCQKLLRCGSDDGDVDGSIMFSISGLVLMMSMWSLFAM